MEQLEYQRLEFISQTNSFTKKSANLLVQFLSLWDDGHYLYICHPNHLLKYQFDQKTKEITAINWETADLNKMIEKNDYKMFSNPLDAKSQFVYSINRLGSELQKASATETNPKRYLTVLEVDYNGDYLIRGIMKGDPEGLLLAINPEYIKTIPGAWERNDRICGYNDPRYAFNNGTAKTYKR